MLVILTKGLGVLGVLEIENAALVVGGDDNEKDDYEEEGGWGRWGHDIWWLMFVFNFS